MILKKHFGWMWALAVVNGSFFLYRLLCIFVSRVLLNIGRMSSGVVSGGCNEGGELPAIHFNFFSHQKIFFKNKI